MNFDKLYAAGRVRRFHTVDIPEQSLAAHSWGVALILVKLFETLPPPPELLILALTHDLAESLTGDVPAPAKWASLDLTDSLKYMESEFNVAMGVPEVPGGYFQDCLKWADMFELCLYGYHQHRMGNKEALTLVRVGVSYLRDMNPPTIAAVELLETLHSLTKDSQ